MKTKLALAIAVLVSNACVVAPTPYDAVVTVAPPPPRVEYQGYPPVVGYVWIGGYWLWTGRRHEWVPGRWEAPRPGYRWVPHRWERDGDRWRPHEGRWESDRSPQPAVLPPSRGNFPRRGEPEASPRKEPLPAYRSPQEGSRRPDASPDRDSRRNERQKDRPGRSDRWDRDR